MPRIIPIKDLKNTAAISQMCSESAEPIYVTKNGYGEMVVMSMQAYEDKMWKLNLYSDLMQAENDIREGRTTDARSAMKELRELHHV